MPLTDMKISFRMRMDFFREFPINSHKYIKFSIQLNDLENGIPGFIVSFHLLCSVVIKILSHAALNNVYEYLYFFWLF